MRTKITKILNIISLALCLFGIVFSAFNGNLTASLWALCAFTWCGVNIMKDNLVDLQKELIELQGETIDQCENFLKQIEEMQKINK